MNLCVNESGHLFGTKPLPELMLTNDQLETWEHT